MNVRIRDVVHVPLPSKQGDRCYHMVCGEWYGQASAKLQTASAVPWVDSVAGRIIPVFIEGIVTEEPATCFLCLTESGT